MKFRILAVLLLCAVLIPAFAQESSEPAPSSPEEPAEAPNIWEINDNPYSKNRMGMGLSLGANFPLFFADPSTGLTSVTNLYPAFTFALNYDYYLMDGFAIGGRLDGFFAASIAAQSFFLLPIQITAHYIWVFLPFEITVRGGIGVVFEQLDAISHTDMIFSAGTYFAYQISTEYSVGLDLSYWFIPQLYPSLPSENRLGNFLDIKACFIYHF